MAEKNYGNPERGRKLLDDMVMEMDIVFGSQEYPWRVRLNQFDYDTLKDWDANHRWKWFHDLFHVKDGHEYLIAVENLLIPFILHYRIVIDESCDSPDVELDDVIDPHVREKYAAAWNRFRFRDELADDRVEL